MKKFKDFRWHKSQRILKASRLGDVYKTLSNYFGPQDWWPGDSPFEVMVGAILTQNTAWTNVEKAIKNLKQERVLTPRGLDSISVERLAALIQPAGYFNVKAKRLKYFIHFLFREYGGNIRRMRKETGLKLHQKLLAVNGIGPETADSILLYALEKPFFVIDAYTKRIFSRHRLTVQTQSSPKRLSLSQDYKVWQSAFENSLPRRLGLFNDFHAQIVAVGKNFCKPHNPLCHDCPLQKYF
ncbi:MAG: endonuclease III domain-containing protein [Candidatus Omnitrophica bacterium]|nr:endonuclease III domain-containing protein [Candidatus Omnitrophota bacterium]